MRTYEEIFEEVYTQYNSRLLGYYEYSEFLRQVSKIYNSQKRG